MSGEISPEREEALIEQAAQFISSHDLEDFAIIALEGTAPFGDVVGELGIMMTYPIALTFFDKSGADFVKMLGFDYQINAERLLKRINELAEEKQILRRRQRELEKLQGKREGWFSRINSRLRSLFKSPEV